MYNVYMYECVSQRWTFASSIIQCVQRILIRSPRFERVEVKTQKNVGDISTVLFRRHSQHQILLLSLFIIVVVANGKQ